MRNSLAKIISWCLGPPILLPTFVFLSFYWSKVNLIEPRIIVLLLITLCLEWALPVLFFIRELRLGKISNLDASNRNQRVVVYSLTLAGWTLGLLLVKFLGPTSLFNWQRVFYSLIFFCVGITYFYKLSIHAAFNFGLFLLLNLVYAGQFFYLLPLPFLAAWSRYQIKNHSLGELTIGALTGVLSIYLGWRSL